MRSKHEICAALVAAMVASVAAGCAHREVTHADSPAPKPIEAIGTTTASAAAGPSTTSNVSVSEELIRACGIHFANVDGSPKFDLDKSDLRPDDDAVLQQVATCLTTGPLKGRSVRLTGRADSRGEVEYNFVLGSHRADAVEKYLNALGVDPAKIQETSRGKLDATGSDEVSWQRDRRVDVDLP